jgi:hypothetical protein
MKAKIEASEDFFLLIESVFFFFYIYIYISGTPPGSV